MCSQCLEMCDSLYEISKVQTVNVLSCLPRRRCLCPVYVHQFVPIHRSIHCVSTYYEYKSMCIHIGMRVHKTFADILESLQHACIHRVPMIFTTTYCSRGFVCRVTLFIPHLFWGVTQA